MSFEFLVSPRDSWRRDGFDQPAFGAGLTFTSVRRGWPPALDPDRAAGVDWAKQLAVDGISVGVTGDRNARCFATRYLAEVMGMGTSVDEQAHALAAWAAGRLEFIQALQPPAGGDLA